MTPDDILARAGDQLSVRRVFGKPVEHDGILVIPVAVAVGGGGGGAGPDEQGSGGGFGGIVRGIGAYTVNEGKVRYVPAIDVVALTALGLLLARTITKAVGRRRHRR